MRHSHGFFRNFLGNIAGWAARGFAVASVLLLSRPGDASANQAKVEGDHSYARQDIGGQISYVQIGHAGDEDHDPPRPE